MNIDTNQPTWGVFECEGLLDVIAKHCTLERVEDDNGNKWTEIAEFDDKEAVRDVLKMHKGLESLHCLMTGRELDELTILLINNNGYLDSFYEYAGRALERLVKSEERDIDLILKKKSFPDNYGFDELKLPSIFTRRQAG